MSIYVLYITVKNDIITTEKLDIVMWEGTSQSDLKNTEMLHSKCLLDCLRPAGVTEQIGNIINDTSWGNEVTLRRYSGKLGIKIEDCSFVTRVEMIYYHVFQQ